MSSWKDLLQMKKKIGYGIFRVGKEGHEIFWFIFYANIIYCTNFKDLY